MRVVVADQKVEDYGVHQARQVEDRRTGDLAQQSKALLEQRPVFFLILVLGDDAQCLAKVLLAGLLKHSDLYNDVYMV